MRTIGKYIGPGRTFDGGITITFEIDDDKLALENLKGFGDSDLVIEANKYYEKKTIQANNYFWKLCDLIARKLGSNKYAIYLWRLQEDGVFVDVRVRPDEVEKLKQEFRYAEAFVEQQEAAEFVEVRCYIGLSHYDKMQMSHLINGTVEEAKKLGIDTWTRDEINRLLSVWGDKHDAERADT